MFNLKRYKKLLFIILVMIIFLLLLPKKKCHIQSFYEEKQDLVFNVSINGNLCSYDKENDRFYYSTNDLNYHKWKVKIHSSYNVEYFIKKDDDNHFILQVYNNKYYKNVDLFITSLPIIDLQNLDLKKNISSDLQFRSGMFENNSDNQNLYESYYAKFNNVNNIGPYKKHVNLKIRGSSSFNFPKKSYKVEFDEKVSIYDLPKDDKYVLDALYIDKSKIRNMLSTSIWDLINDNQRINNDLHGKFVELFIDNEYKGLYVLKDKVDKSVTQISDSGILLKSIIHFNDFYLEQLLNYDYSISNNVFLNYEIKKYNNASFYSIVNKLKDYYSCYSFECIQNAFDVDNYINYMLFVSFLSGSDNVRYNKYLSLYDSDSKILITPWDMDLTLGLNWFDFSELPSVFYENSSYDVNWMNDNITKNMDDRTLSILKQRYWELRKDVITMDTINNYLNSYKELLVDSGAALRDSERWYEYDVEFEIERIREWASRRIQFLDEYFK